MSYVIPDPRWEMPELLTPGRKPVGNVVIDWDHPLTRGLTGFFLMQDKEIINLVDGIQDISSNTELTVRHGKQGVDSTTLSPIITHKVGATSSITVISKRTYEGPIQNNHGALFGTISGGLGFELVVTEGTGALWWATQHVFAINSTGDTITEDKVYTFGFAYDENTGTNIYLDGVQTSTDATTGALTSITPLQEYNRGDTLAGFYSNGVIYHTMVFDRGLSEVDYLSLYRNPYQFLIPA